MSNLAQRIFTIIKEPQLASFATLAEESKPWVRYVTCYASEDLTIRFSTFIGSRKVAQIKKNPEVHLTCGVPNLATAQTSTAQTYLQIQGKAELSIDKTEREAFWNDYLTRYFKGPDDPNYGIIIVKPYRIELYTMGNFKPEVWKK
jgi:general stress protein 26